MRRNLDRNSNSNNSSKTQPPVNTTPFWKQALKTAGWCLMGAIVVGGFTAANAFLFGAPLMILGIAAGAGATLGAGALLGADVADRRYTKIETAKNSDVPTGFFTRNKYKLWALSAFTFAGSATLFPSALVAFKAHLIPALAGKIIYTAGITGLLTAGVSGHLTHIKHQNETVDREDALQKASEKKKKMIAAETALQQANSATMDFYERIKHAKAAMQNAHQSRAKHFATNSNGLPYSNYQIANRLATSDAPSLEYADLFVSNTSTADDIAYDAESDEEDSRISPRYRRLNDKYIAFLSIQNEKMNKASHETDGDEEQAIEYRQP